ncbi:hypothetical protein [Hyphobacterium sp.]|uniref:hypothetical protein n=1 Tax=Hyphobacterium sp. TaxID=2004662 RepID=UPI0037491F5E
MKKYLFLGFLLCALAAPAEAQLREDGYFVASGIDGWDYDSEYWIETGHAAVVPYPSNPTNARCVIHATRQAYSRAALDRLYGGANEASLRREMEQLDQTVHHVIDVQTVQTLAPYRVLRRIYFLRSYDNIIIEYFIGGANGIVTIRCTEDHRIVDNFVQYQAPLRRSIEVLEQVQIELSPPQ